MEPFEHGTTLANLIEHNLGEHPNVKEKPNHKERFKNTTGNVISRKIAIVQKKMFVKKSCFHSSVVFDETN